MPEDFAMNRSQTVTATYYRSIVHCNMNTLAQRAPAPRRCFRLVKDIAERDPELADLRSIAFDTSAERPARAPPKMEAR